MTQKNKAKWREEFEGLNALVSDTASSDLEFERYHSNGDYRSFQTQIAWLGYLAACRKRQEEIGKFALSAFESIEFVKTQCAENEKLLMTEHTEACDEYEKEIITLKEGIEKVQTRSNAETNVMIKQTQEIESLKKETYRISQNLKTREQDILDVLAEKELQGKEIEDLKASGLSKKCSYREMATTREAGIALITENEAMKKELDILKQTPSQVHQLNMNLYSKNKKLRNLVDRVSLTLGSMRLSVIKGDLFIKESTVKELLKEINDAFQAIEIKTSEESKDKETTLLRAVLDDALDAVTKFNNHQGENYIESTVVLQNRLENALAEANKLKGV